MEMGDISLSALIGDCYCLKLNCRRQLIVSFLVASADDAALCSLFWPRGTWTRDKMRCVAGKSHRTIFPLQSVFNFSITSRRVFFSFSATLRWVNVNRRESVVGMSVDSLLCICISHPFVSVSCVSHRHRRTRNDKNVVEMKLNKRIKRAENACICSRLLDAWLPIFRSHVSHLAKLYTERTSKGLFIKIMKLKMENARHCYYVCSVQCMCVTANGRRSNGKFTTKCF